MLITVVIGGTTYTVKQADVVDYFSRDTGLTQQQAEQYVSSLEEDDLAPWEDIGISYVDSGEKLVLAAREIDCNRYTYEWESDSLPCSKVKTQIYKIGIDSVSLGRAYEKLGSDTASKEDMLTTINLIDIVKADYDLEAIRFFMDSTDIEEDKKTGSYNKALLKTVLESDQGS